MPNLNLTREQKENIYREIEHEYRIEDAKRQYENVAAYLANAKPVLEMTDADYEMLVENYMDSFDCNVAENDTWYNVIMNYLGNNT